MALTGLDLLLLDIDLYSCARGSGFVEDRSCNSKSTARLQLKEVLETFVSSFFDRLLVPNLWHPRISQLRQSATGIGEAFEIDNNENLLDGLRPEEKRMCPSV